MTLRIEPYVVGVKTSIWYMFSPSVVYSGQFFNKLDSLKGGAFRLFRVDGENFILRQQNALLSKRAMERDALEDENNRLRSLLDLKQKKFGDAVAATVTGRDWREWFRSVVIDKGEESGILFSAAVVSSAGEFPTLVGRVLEVGDKTSKVLLITDAASAVSVRVEGRSDVGLLEGSNRPWVSLNYLSQTSEAQAGDRVVTAGLGGVFPPGIPVGVIESVAASSDGYFKTAKIVPFSPLTSLRDVLVLRRNEIFKEEKKP
jgi:rod shape-determining protein MreC